MSSKVTPLMSISSWGIPDALSIRSDSMSDEKDRTSEPRVRQEQAGSDRPGGPADRSDVSDRASGPPPGHRAEIALTITDDFPLAQAIVIISAVPAGN